MCNYRGCLHQQLDSLCFAFSMRSENVTLIWLGTYLYFLIHIQTDQASSVPQILEILSDTKSLGWRSCLCVLKLLLKTSFAWFFNVFSRLLTPTISKTCSSCPHLVTCAVMWKQCPLWREGMFHVLCKWALYQETQTCRKDQGLI